MQSIVVRDDRSRAAPQLQAYFCEGTGLPVASISETLKRYEEVGRHYHSLGHLAMMLANADAHSIQLSQAQCLAVLFHDAVYLPGAPRGQNEVDSAELLKEQATGYVAAGTIEVAAQIVLDTAIHYPSQDDSFVVLDLDLLGLAGTIENVRADGELVYLEYRDRVDGREHFTAARAQFFREMLGRHKILWSQQLSGYEVQLRANLVDVVANPGI